MFVLFILAIYEQGDETKQMYIDGIEYVFHYFRKPGTHYFSPPDSIPINYIIVGGGGGGGSRHGGGGGAGGVIIAKEVLITLGNYTVKVGNGGEGGFGTGSYGKDGEDSSFWEEIAKGGGGGGSAHGGTLPSYGRNGGCGGGAANNERQGAPGGDSIQPLSKRGIAYGNKGGNDITTDRKSVV